MRNRASYLKELNLLEDRDYELYTNTLYIQDDRDVIIEIERMTGGHSIVVNSIEKHAERATQLKSRLIAVNIHNSGINDLDTSICSVFKQNNSNNKTLNAFLMETHLYHLEVTCNNLKQITPSINRFNNLLSLNLSGNNIIKISHDIILPHIISLNLAKNMISNLQFLTAFQSLIYLNLSRNDITDIDKALFSIMQLKRLKKLDLSKNSVSTKR